MEVTAAGADGVRDAATESMHEGRHFLDAGSRGADHADGPATNAVREAEADTVDDRRPALRPHDEQAAPARPALERSLVVQRDAIAEEKHVQSGRERLLRLEGGVRARHRHDRDAGRRRAARGGADRARHHVIARGLAVAPRAQELFDSRQRAMGDRVALRANGDQEIGRPGLRRLR